MQVVYTRGPLLWQGFTLLGNTLNKKKLAARSNAPSQEYNPADRSVINRAAILGAVSVEASGTYAPLVSSIDLPHIRRSSLLTCPSALFDSCVLRLLSTVMYLYTFQANCPAENERQKSF